MGEFQAYCAAINIWRSLKILRGTKMQISVRRAELVDFLSLLIQGLPHLHHNVFQLERLVDEVKI
jgi:hypothetical protein